MRYISLFSGVGGFDIGAHQAGWECVQMVEWDDKARGVLDHHWPEVPKWGDVQTFSAQGLVADAIVGGFPCQDVSIAGRRAGMGEGTRSGLYSHIIRIAKEMQHGTNGTFPRWIILENVRGLLSVDKGQAFAGILDDLADLGAVEIEWGMCDTQYFGPPQQRRRIFVVACFDPRATGIDIGSVLPLAEGSTGNPRPRRKKGQGTPDADRISPPSNLTANRGITTALTAMEGMERPDLAHAQAGWLVPYVAPIQDTRPLDKNQNGLGVKDDGEPAYTLDAQGTQGVVVQSLYAVQDPCGTVTSKWAKYSGGPAGNELYNLIAEVPTTFFLWPDDAPGIPGALKALISDIAPTICASDGAKKTDRGLRVAYEASVRRLTPLECERLQGWPDNHTLIGLDGKEQKDTVRYMQIGNGISSPVAKWVCENLNNAEITLKTAENAQ